MSHHISSFRPSGASVQPAGSDGAERNSGDTNFSLPGGGDHGAGGGVRCLGAPAKTRPGGDGQREEAGRKQMAGSHIHTRVVEQLEFKNTGFETSRGKSHRHFRFCPRPLTRETRMSVYLFLKKQNKVGSFFIKKMKLLHLRES